MFLQAHSTAHTALHPKSQNMCNISEWGQVCTSIDAWGVWAEILVYEPAKVSHFALAEVDFLPVW